MKKVLHVRIPVYLNAEIVSSTKNYAGLIGNLSEKGAYVEIGSTRTVTPFIPGKTLKIKFKESAKNTLNLNCEVKWLYTKKFSPGNFTNSLGLIIINPSPKYTKYFKTL